MTDSNRGSSRIGTVPRLCGRASVLAGVWIFCVMPAAADEPANEAPLFMDDTVLAMEFELDFTRICRDPTRGDCEDLPTTVYYFDAEDNRHRTDVKLRTRGRWRRGTGNCAFPAMFAYFDEEQNRGTLFEGQKTLALTTHCQHAKRNYEGYTLKEYLAYRFYNLLTDASMRVRLARIVYRDSASGREYERYGFFSEHFDDLARRLGGERYEVDKLDPRDIDATELATLSVFQYMIGNLDWSVIVGHNIVVFRRHDGTLVPVPFDFDYSGLVNARYAVPPDIAKLRNVRTRKYWGFCRADIDWNGVFPRFLALRSDVAELVQDLLDGYPKEHRQTADYLTFFYETIESEKRRRKYIVEACRPVPKL